LNSHAANGFTDAPMSKGKNKNLHHSVIKDMIEGIFEPFLKKEDDEIRFTSDDFSRLPQNHFPNQESTTDHSQVTRVKIGHFR
jgi:hypothetical protein